MPLIKGALSYQRFRVEQDQGLSPEQIVEKLRLFKFRPLHDRGHDQETMGWSSYLAEYDTEKEIEISDILYDEKIVLSLRYDTVALPKPLLKSLIKRSLAAYHSEYKKWPDRVVKKEIEQAEIASLRAKILPKTRIVEALWCQNSQELRIFTRSSSLIDRFVDLFKSTFKFKAVHRDFVHDAYWFATSTNQIQELSLCAHAPLFAPAIRMDIQ